jgi:hypothetical protein
MAPGQAHELPMAPVLLSFLTALALWIVADRGYASHAFRTRIWDLGARPAIPAKRNDERRRAFIRSPARPGSTTTATLSSAAGPG